MLYLYVFLLLKMFRSDPRIVTMHKSPEADMWPRYLSVSPYSQTPSLTMPGCLSWGLPDHHKWSIFAGLCFCLWANHRSSLLKPWAKLNLSAFKLWCHVLHHSDGKGDWHSSLLSKNFVSSNYGEWTKTGRVYPPKKISLCIRSQAIIVIIIIFVIIKVAIRWHLWSPVICHTFFVHCLIYLSFE